MKHSIQPIAKGADESIEPPLLRPPGDEITIYDFVRYEILSSWWAPLIFWGWGQDLVASYYDWKAKVNYKRYQKMLARRKQDMKPKT